MWVSIIRVSRDTGVYYYPPRGDANRTYSTIATQYYLVSYISLFINTRRACTARVTVLSLYVCVCVCESVTSLTAMPLTHRYKVRYESNKNALLKVFESWISLKILCSKVTALFAHLNELRRFRRQGDTSKDYWRLLVG